MNHEDHINLLRQGIPNRGGNWADLGSGTGAFTLALADLSGPSARIYSVDKDKGALKEQERLHPSTRLAAARWHRHGELAPLRA